MVQEDFETCVRVVSNTPARSAEQDLMPENGSFVKKKKNRTKS